MNDMAQFLPLWGFIVMMVATPGPANLLLMSAGAQQGFARTTPFIAGLITGKLLLNVALALGLIRLLPEDSPLGTLFMMLSAAYMAYLALRNWTPGVSNQNQKDFTFLNGIIVHPLSPKTWVMTTLALTQFGISFDSPAQQLAVVPLSFLVAQLLFHSLWCLSGAALNRVFRQSLLMHRTLILLTLLVILWAVYQ